MLAKFETELDRVKDLGEDLAGFFFEVLGFAVCLVVFLAVFLDFDLSALVAAKAEEVCSKKKRGKKSKINRKVYIILQLFFIGSF
ncbi:MAG: hypothetical protein JHC25_06790 [Thermodesulfobacterium sp.]|nr:hypothetical protein [Thermodesulfobacterium sp.]